MAGTLIFLRQTLLALGLALLLLWPISYWIGVSIHRPIYGGDGYLIVLEGRVRLSRQVLAGVPPDPASMTFIRPIPELQNDRWRYLLPRYVKFDNALSGRANRFYGVAFDIPLWLPATACLLWPALAFHRRRRDEPRGFDVEPNDTP